MSKYIFVILITIQIALLQISCKTGKTNITKIPETRNDTLSDSSRLAFYKGDTIAYVNYLVKNQIKYIGKPLSVLLNDLDFVVYRFGTTSAANDKRKSFSLILIGSPYDNPGKPDKYGINQDIELGVGWKTYVPRDSIQAIGIANGPPDHARWSKRAEEYFGKQIVGNLWLNYYMKR